MNLPDGIKHAVHMGANEAFLEWTCDPTEDGLDLLGTSYQRMGEDAASPADANRFITDLEAWDDGSIKGPPAEKFELLMCKAGIDLARGIIAQAANVGTVPDRAKPYMAELAPLVAGLKQALEGGDGDVDDEWLSAIIWGGEIDEDDNE